uniref:Uncharacterized protein n=1 Tax=Timema cristinae TaxID=61476 RepID=A0A7R9GS55_TIMCR|nr:unnamed protein product [Timema cristinae]
MAIYCNTGRARTVTEIVGMVGACAERNVFPRTIAALCFGFRHQLEQNKEQEYVRDKYGWFFEQNIVTKFVRCSARPRSTSCRILPVTSKDVHVWSCCSLDAFVNISPDMQSLARKYWSNTLWNDGVAERKLNEAHTPL